MGPWGPSQRSQSLLRVERVPLCRSRPHREGLALASGTLMTAGHRGEETEGHACERVWHRCGETAGHAGTAEHRGVERAERELPTL